MAAQLPELPKKKIINKYVQYLSHLLTFKSKTSIATNMMLETLSRTAVQILFLNQIQMGARAQNSIFSRVNHMIPVWLASVANLFDLN